LSRWNKNLFNEKPGYYPGYECPIFFLGMQGHAAVYCRPHQRTLKIGKL